VPDAIDSMYRSDVAGAVIVDDVRTSFGKFVDRDIGFVEFPSLVLWAIEEFDKLGSGAGDKNSDFLTSLKQHPQIAETKVHVSLLPRSTYQRAAISSVVH
jgi:hypothetical protein